MGRSADLSRGKVQGVNAGPAPRVGIFARVGEIWTIGLDGNGLPFRDLKGFHDIQRLLQHPGEEFHALDLLREPGVSQGAEKATKVDLLSNNPSVHIEGLGDAGEMLDERAKQEYRQKRRELLEELEEYRERGDAERADQIEEQIEFLSREISRAVGIGGRDRRAGSAAERARLNVTRAIRTALEKIAEHDKVTAVLLDRSIRTGIFCRHVVDPSAPIAWQFSHSDKDIGLAATLVSAPAASAPPLQLTGSNLIGSHAERTTFVGRDKERAALRSVLEQVRAGSGRVVTIAGVPGVGKTRIAVEFARQAEAEGVSVLTGACYDRDDAVPFIPFVEIFESALAQAPHQDTLRSILGDDAPEIARLVPQLRRLFPDMPASIELSPQQTRRMLFVAATKVLGRLASDRPLLLLLDDLHWADEGTLALLTHLVRSIASTRIMILGTFRDDKFDLGAPLAKMVDDLTRIHILSNIKLVGLREQAVGEMIEALGGREAPAQLVKFVYAGTEGNPFFVEELFRHLTERGQLFDNNGEFRRDIAMEQLDVPQSLRLILGRRLLCLSPAAQEMLAIAAVIGPSFAFELLENSSGIAENPLLDQIEEAEEAALLIGALHGSEARFHFSHELLRQTALAGISPARLQRLHLDIANAIEKTYPASLEDKVDDLAYHLWQAGNAADAGRTISCLREAAGKAQAQSAYESALVLLANALTLVENLPEPAERDRQELELYLQYLPILKITNRWTTGKAGASYLRARELCERTGQTARMFRLLQGSTLYHLGRGELTLARDYADHLMEMSAQPEWAATANYLRGHILCCLGDLPGAHRNLSAAVKIRDSLPASLSAGRSAKVNALAIDGLVLWMLGLPDQALTSANRAVASARETSNAFDLAIVQTQLHIVLFFRREYSRALQAADEALKICIEKKFEWVQTSVEWSRAACRVMAGVDQNFDRVQKTFDIYFGSEAKLYRAYNCAVLAQCAGVLGRPEVGIPVIEESFKSMEQNRDYMAASETSRIKGNLLLQLAQRESGTQRQKLEKEGEVCLTTALEVADRHQANGWKLRAALSLSRLLIRSGRKPEARNILSDALVAFTEGRETPDLIEANSLLADMSAK